MNGDTIFNPECITYSQMNLIFNSRVYYRRLTTWIRSYILGRYFGVGTAEELFGRLYLETLRVSYMLEIVFGRESSEEYSRLLSQFAIIIRDLVSAELEGNTEEVNRNVERLYQNVADRAAFLAAINPYWSEEEYYATFAEYVRLLLEIIDSIAEGVRTGDYSRDIELYSYMSEIINRLGDTFAEGLYDYITSGLQYTWGTPPPAEGQCLTYDEMNAIFGIRMFWFELETWTRNYMLSRYSGLGNADETAARLRQVADDYVNSLRQIFGDAVPENYVQLFYDYFDLLGALITAQLEGDADEAGRLTQLLYRNADERAAAIASINPFWDEENWRNRLYNHLRSTIDLAISFQTGNYARNTDIFSRLLDAAEGTSNYFSEGLLNYLSSNLNSTAGYQRIQV